MYICAQIASGGSCMPGFGAAGRAYGSAGIVAYVPRGGGLSALAA